MHINKYIPEEIKNIELPELIYIDQPMVRYRVMNGLSAKWVKTRLGRYLRRVNKDWTDEQVKQAVAELRGSAVRYNVSMTEAGDADAIARIYKDGPDSCMSGGKSAYLHHHIRVDGEFYAPVRVYAHPDNNLRLMYAMVDDTVVARCWVNVENMTHNRVYASTDVYANSKRVLEDYLKEQGYRHDPEECMLNELLLLVETDCGAVVCPYIDPDNMGVSIEEDCLIIGCGSHEANYETGCLYEYDLAVRSCAECGDSVPESELNNVEPEPVCDSCMEDYYVLAHSRWGEEYRHIDCCSSIVDADGDCVGYMYNDWPDDDYVELTTGRYYGYYTDEYAEDEHGDRMLISEAESRGLEQHSDGIWYDYPEEGEDDC